MPSKSQVAVRQEFTIIEQPSFCELIKPFQIAGRGWYAETPDISGCKHKDLRYELSQQEVFHMVYVEGMVPCSLSQITKFLELQAVFGTSRLLVSGGGKDEYNFFCVMGREWRPRMVLLYCNERSREWNLFAWPSEKNLSLPRGSRFFYNAQP